MTTVTQLTQALQEVFTTTADALARRTGFVQRTSKLTGALFAQTLVVIAQRGSGRDLAGSRGHEGGFCISPRKGAVSCFCSRSDQALS